MTTRRRFLWLGTTAGASACVADAPVAPPAPPILSLPGHMRTIEVDLQGPNVGRGDHSADTAAIAAALAQVNQAPDRRIRLHFGSPVRYRSAAWLQFTRPDISISAVPGACLVAHDTLTAPVFVVVDHAPRLVWERLALDVNSAARPVTSDPYSGLRLLRCHDSLITECSIRGARGFPEAPGIAPRHANACVAAESDRVTMRRSACYDSPSADGFYIQGRQGLIEEIDGSGWGDTLAVLEGSSDGTIRRIRGSYGGALWAVSNFTNADHGNNLVDDVEGFRLNAYSGGGRIATLNTGGGKLLDTRVRNVRMRHCAGPGIHIHEAPTTPGYVDGVTFEDVHLEDCLTQGLLMDGGRNVRGFVTTRRTGASAVQAWKRARDIDLTVDIETDKLTGAIAESVPNVTYRGTVRGLNNGMAWGAYWYGACPGAKHALQVTGATHGPVGPVGAIAAAPPLT